MIFSKFADISPYRYWYRYRYFSHTSYRYRYFPKSPYRYRYRYRYFWNCLIDIDIFKNDNIDIDIFQKCWYIDNRYFITIYRIGQSYHHVCVQNMPPMNVIAMGKTNTFVIRFCNKDQVSCAHFALIYRSKAPFQKFSHKIIIFF